MTDMSDSLPKEIGSVLRHRREELHLTLEEVAEETKIRKSYILALEEDNFHELPGKVYVVGFVRNYARLLSLPVDPLLEALTDVHGAVKKNEAAISELRAQEVFASKNSSLKIWLWIAIILVVLAAVGIYFFPGLIDATRRSNDGSQAPVSQTDNPQELSVKPAGTEGAGAVSSGEAMLPQQGQPEDDIPLVIPPGGGALKLIVDGRGKFVISIDGDTAREYLAQPGLTLSWPVREMVDLRLDVDGKVLLQLNDQQYSVTGKQHLLLQSKKESEG